MPLDTEDVLKKERVESGKRLWKQLRSFLCSWGLPAWLADGIAAMIAGFWTVFEFLFAEFMAAVIAVSTAVIGAFFSLLKTVRKEGLKEFDELTIDSLSELLGVDLDASHLKPSGSRDAALKNARAIGAQLHTTLFNEFTAAGKDNPQRGRLAAEAFTGYVTRFAMVNSIISLLGDSLSLHHVTQLRELGEEVANHLGLGRMHRRAIQPLIEQTITKPYARQLQYEFREDHLTDIQLIRAFQSGDLTLEQCKDHLAHKGYPDEEVLMIIKQLENRLNDTEIETLLRYTGGTRQRLSPSTDDGNFGATDITPLTKEAALKILLDSGVSEVVAKQRLVSNALKRADSDVSAYAAELENLAYGGWIDADSARLEIASLPLSPEEKHWKLAKFGARLENPRRRITLAQLQLAFEEGIVTLDYVVQWLDAEGYSPEDQEVLLYETLIKLKEYEDKQKAKAAAKAKIASKPPKKKP